MPWPVFDFAPEFVFVYTLSLFTKHYIILYFYTLSLLHNICFVLFYLFLSLNLSKLSAIWVGASVS